MKKIIAAALCAFGMTAFATTDYWLFADGKITDGDWTFSASADKNRKMTVGQVSLTPGEFPTTLTPLDLSKPVKDGEENIYTITTLNCGFVVGSDKYGAQEPAQYVSSLTLPPTATSVGSFSFGWLVNATGTLTWPTNLTSVARFSFYKGGFTINAEDLVVLKTISTGSSFEGVNVVGDLVLTNVVGTVPTGSFASTKITSVKFGPGLTSIVGGYNGGAFSDCSNLKSIEFDENSTVSIGVGAVFARCTSLEELNLRCVKKIVTQTDVSHSNMTTYACFYGCNKVKKISIGDKLEFLHYLVFASCGALEEVHYYGAPCEELGYPVYALWEASNATADTRSIKTFVHIDSDDAAAKAAWDAYTAGGEINSVDSTWRSDMVGTASSCALRPLLLYQSKTVSISGGVDGDMEHGIVGTYIISRAESDTTTGALSVNYSVGGTAENGVDYELLSGTIDIPDGERSVTLQVVPRYNGAVSTKDMSVTLSAGEGYEIDSEANTASINISCCYRSVSIKKLRDADEGTGAYGLIEISRGEGDADTVPLEVELMFSGSAVAGQTYKAIGSSVIIPAGKQSVIVRVDPLDDPAVTEDSSVVITIVGDGYDIVHGVATVGIANGATYGGWKVYNGYMTDGTWKFTISVRSDRFPDGSRYTWITDIQTWPGVPSELNFDKSYMDCYYGYAFHLRSFQGNTTKASSRGFVSSLVLPTDVDHPYVLEADSFSSCTNLVSVTPFLPPACEGCYGAFKNCEKLETPLVLLEGTSIGGTGTYSQFSGCKKLPSVDMSQSTQNTLSRETFHDCISLEWVKFPPTFEKFGSCNSDSMSDREPFWGHWTGTAAVNGAHPKLYFTGKTLPTPPNQMDIPTIGYIEFLNGVDELPDNAFKKYPNLTNVVIRGEKPATIGANLFTGITANKLTVYVEAEHVDSWKPVATGNIITADEGEWISGTTQKIRGFGYPKPSGLVIIVR